MAPRQSSGRRIGGPPGRPASVPLSLLHRVTKPVAASSGPGSRPARASASGTARAGKSGGGRAAKTGGNDAGDAGSGTAGIPGRKLRQLDELPVTVLDKVGTASARELAELGIETVLDLLTHYPRRYIDGTRLAPLSELAEGDTASVLATVRRVNRPPSGRYRRGPTRVELDATDGTGRFKVVFFNQAWRAKQLPVGTLALFFGKLGTYRDNLQMVNPTVEVVSAAGSIDADEDQGGDGRSGTDNGNATGRIYPVYPLSEKADLTSTRITRFVGEALKRAGTFAEPLAARWRSRFELIDRTRAFHEIHQPATMAEREPARRRLAFDELFRLQLALVLRQRRLESDARGIRHVLDSAVDGQPSLLDQFLARLPFEPTGAQLAAIAAMSDDLAGPLPMHRLLQGDVGAGKTVVAVATLLVAVQGGHQGALMAPTEVLAEQHFFGVRSLLDGLSLPDPTTLEGSRPLRVALLTSKTPAAERARLHRGLADGGVDLLIGTHALLTDDVRFHSLGAVVIDEQHRFGVEQRAALKAKGRGDDGLGADPDLLVMTATPIPRTAAMVVFGDLDMTTIDELPPGRTPITTQWARTAMDEVAAWERVRTEVAAGHRAFVVCPLVEGSERVEAASATDEALRLAAEELKGLRIGLLHGQMRPGDKESVMADFRTGALDVLVATTVIEVGVDVPEATVMVIEDADRFGIAQLHQLRGRVGRGSDPSWCFLLSESEAPEAEARLSAMERTTDGFELADVDLELRGEGTILGARQKGRSDLKLASLLRDRDLVDQAREVAEAVVAEDPLLGAHQLLEEELRLFIDDDEAEFLFKS
ncbi:MAG TPA: ATP-dependent DNA helicase RecG [Acidimicrobiales bacterium]|nr:ATP-dependent DNA helicase RecG [Acidimicrobiales bacterium]